MVSPGLNPFNEAFDVSDPTTGCASRYNGAIPEFVTPKRKLSALADHSTALNLYPHALDAWATLPMVWYAS